MQQRKRSASKSSRSPRPCVGAVETEPAAGGAGPEGGGAAPAPISARDSAGRREEAAGRDGRRGQWRVETRVRERDLGAGARQR